MKYEKLIYVQIIIDVKVHLDMVRVLTRSQESEVLEVLEVGL